LTLPSDIIVQRSIAGPGISHYWAEAVNTPPITIHQVAWTCSILVSTVHSYRQKSNLFAQKLPQASQRFLSYLPSLLICTILIISPRASVHLDPDSSQ